MVRVTVTVRRLSGQRELCTSIECSSNYVIFQVNGINVEWVNYSRVADMIRAGGNKLDLLVVDDDSDQFFDQENITLSKYQPFVDVINCPDETVSNAHGVYTLYNTVNIQQRCAREWELYWVPWDSHGNGSDVECTMGMRMGVGIKAWEWV